jgi:tripartite-type tricarboxylate transporter receptor subunit TctC
MALALFGQAVASAQSVAAYPSRPITMVVGFPAGTTTDGIARILAEALGDQLGNRMVVENKAGVSGNLSASLVAQAAPDGYTLYLGAVGLASSVSANPSAIKVNPVTGLSHVGLVAYTPNVLITGVESPIRSVDDIRKRSQTPPGLTFGSSGVGGGLHLTGEIFRVRTGTQLVHVPYRGSAPATLDLIGNRLDLQFDNLAGALPLIREGKVRALALTTSKRRTEIPDVPTMAEAGVTDLEAGAWFSLMGPPSMPPELLERLSGDLGKALASPRVQQYFTLVGLETLTSRTPEEAKNYIAKDVERWRKIVEETGFKVE